MPSTDAITPTSNGTAVALLQQAVLREELDRPVARAVDADLQAAHQAEAVFQPDLRAGVEPEEILEQVAEVALSQRPAEAVGHAKRALEPRHAQRGRQA